MAGSATNSLCVPEKWFCFFICKWHSRIQWPYGNFQEYMKQNWGFLMLAPVWFRETAMILSPIPPSAPCPLFPVNMPSERELKALEKETEYEVRCPRMMVLSDLFSNSSLFSFPLPLFEIQIFRILHPQYCFSYPNIPQCQSLSPPNCLSYGRQTDLLETYFWSFTHLSSKKGGLSSQYVSGRHCAKC